MYVGMVAHMVAQYVCIWRLQLLFPYHVCMGHLSDVNKLSLKCYLMIAAFFPWNLELGNYIKQWHGYCSIALRGHKDQDQLQKESFSSWFVFSLEVDLIIIARREQALHQSSRKL